MPIYLPVTLLHVTRYKNSEKLERKKMKIDIDKLTESELVDLNHRIVGRLKFLESMHHHQEMMKFSIGEKVSFEPPGRGRQMGTLVKYNKKSVTVITEAGQKWTVSPHLLSKIKHVKKRNVKKQAKESNIIEFVGKK
jgi:hypothetical protein